MENTKTISKHKKLQNIYKKLDMRILYIIPARGGSKGIPHKNIKLLNGMPLICYSIATAREMSNDSDICVTTDSNEIKKIVENNGLKVPFIRPREISTDTSSTNELIMHALDYYKSINKFYDVVVLLQPTSPLRKPQHIREALKLYSEEIDMVVSVKRSHAANVICHEDENGFIITSLKDKSCRRQDMKPFYEINGAIYIINVKSLELKGLQNFNKKIKYIMEEEFSIDIDTYNDWAIAEFYIKKHQI